MGGGGSGLSHLSLDLSMRGCPLKQCLGDPTHLGAVVCHPFRRGTVREVYLLVKLGESMACQQWVINGENEA